MCFFSVGLSNNFSEAKYAIAEIISKPLLSLIRTESGNQRKCFPLHLFFFLSALRLHIDILKWRWIFQSCKLFDLCFVWKLLTIWFRDPIGEWDRVKMVLWAWTREKKTEPLCCKTSSFNVDFTLFMFSICLSVFHVFFPAFFFSRTNKRASFDEFFFSLLFHLVKLGDKQIRRCTQYNQSSSWFDGNVSKSIETYTISKIVTQNFVCVCLCVNILFFPVVFYRWQNEMCCATDIIIKGNWNGIP